MRAETPVEVPVDVHPCRSAPRRIGAALGVEGRLARRDARNGVGQPELALVHKVLVDEPLRFDWIEVVEDQREERGEREHLCGPLPPTREIPEHTGLLVPALRLERRAHAARP